MLPKAAPAPSQPKEAPMYPALIAQSRYTNDPIAPAPAVGDLVSLNALAAPLSGAAAAPPGTRRLQVLASPCGPINALAGASLLQCAGFALSTDPGFNTSGYTIDDYGCFVPDIIDPSLPFSFGIVLNAIIASSGAGGTPAGNQSWMVTVYARSELDSGGPLSGVLI